MLGSRALDAAPVLTAREALVSLRKLWNGKPFRV